MGNTAGSGQLNPPPPSSLVIEVGGLQFFRQACKVYVPPLQSSGLEGSSWPDPAVSFYIYTETFNVIILEIRILLVYTGFLANISLYLHCATARAKTKPK